MASHDKLSPLPHLLFALNKRLALRLKRNLLTFNFPTKILRLNLMHFCFSLLTNSINVYPLPPLPLASDNPIIYIKQNPKI